MHLYRAASEQRRQDCSRGIAKDSVAAFSRSERIAFHASALAACFIACKLGICSSPDPQRSGTDVDGLSVGSAGSPSETLASSTYFTS